MLLKKTIIWMLILALTPFSLRWSAVAQEQNKNGDEIIMDKFLEGTLTAPEFPDGLEWLNTEQPLTLKELKGKLVLLDFWTFCCINCMHVIPDLKKLEEKYPNELVVIGVHSAKFTNEQSTDQIRQAILRYDVRHPVVNDRDFEIWSLYNIHAWPSFVLINPEGKIIGTHSGEGIYALFDEIIGKGIKYFAAKNMLDTLPLKLSLEESKLQPSLLSFPGKISADSSAGRLFITDSDHDRIIVAQPDGLILDIIGSGRAGQKDGGFGEAEFLHPQGTCPDGNFLYIADTENHLIRKANLKTRMVETVFGCGQQAEQSNLAGSGTSVCLNSPWDLAVYNNKLYIAMAGSHQLWIADLQSMEIRPYAGSGREARIDGPLLQAALAQPSGISTNGKKLYFADSETSSIRSADLDSQGEVRTIVGKDLFEFGDIDGSSEKARLQHPLGIAFYHDSLLVADTYNSKIKIIDPIGKTSRTLAGQGKPGYMDGKLSAARFNEPGGLAMLDGKIYVADVNNHQIRVIDLKTNLVGTLKLSNLEKRVDSTKTELTSQTIQIPSQKLGIGKGKIALNLRLPKKYRFIEQAPYLFEIKSADERVVRIAAPQKLNGGSNLLPIEISVQTEPGQTEIYGDLTVYFCDKKTGLCSMEKIGFDLPLEVNSSGESNITADLSLEVQSQF